MKVVGIIKSYIKNVIGKFKKDEFQKFLLTNLHSVQKQNLPLAVKADTLYVFAVAFNNEMLLQNQIDLLNKNLKDPFVFIVVDNSNKPSKRELIAEVCRKNQVAYISLPKNPETDGSRSHAICLNWIYKNYILKLKPTYFGFIDHDVFCIKPDSVIKVLKKQPVYGCYQERENYWYLWAGFCFFNYDKLREVNFDFSTCIINQVGLDTGGFNWNSLYSNLKKEELEFTKNEYVSIRDGNSVQSSSVEIMSNWLHSFNGSYWLEMPQKENELRDFLIKYY